MRFCDMLLKYPAIEAWVKEALDGVPVIECDNVSKYFFEESDQEFWDMGDFPNIVPPFETFWLDFKAPEKVISKERGITIWKDPAPRYWGFLCYGIPFYSQEDRDYFIENTAPYHRHYFESIIDKAKWGMDMYLHLQQADPYGREVHNMGPLWGWRMIIGEDGMVVANPENGEATVSTAAISEHIKEGVELGKHSYEDYYNIMLPYWHTALLAMSFMHCNNVYLHEVKPPLQTVHNKAQKRRGVKPYQPVPYKVLDIRPMREVLRTEGQSERVGVKKALHIARGHFRHYENGRGLFGKYKGTYWIPQHIRGSKERGITTKDYRITGLDTLK